MKEMVRYGLTLALICIVAGGLLAGTYSLTRPKIIAQAQAEEGAGLEEVMPEAARFEPIKKGDEVIYYRALDKDGKFIGTAFKASGKGYSSIIEVIAGMLKDGTITNIKVISQNETPGLGAQVSEKNFTQQFKDKKDLNEVTAITGATISSRAVIDSVKKRALEIKELIKNE